MKQRRNKFTHNLANEPFSLALLCSLEIALFLNSKTVMFRWPVLKGLTFDVDVGDI